MVRELRHPDHVFRADSLATLRDAPVTIGHPDAGQTWVDPENAEKLEVGVVHDAKAHEQYVDARLTVRRADAIRRIDSKELVEVSAAYDADIDPTPGVFEGQPYDQVQTNITYNHVALLPLGKGRAGRDVRLRADSTDAIVEEDAPAPKAPAPSVSGEQKPPAAMGEQTMNLRKLRVDGVEYELPETAASVLEKLVSERDAAKKSAEEAGKRADGAEAKVDMLKADLDKARDPKTISGFVSQRVELERAAGKVLGQDQTLDGLTDRQVREKVLSVASPAFKTEGRSDDAITAAFEYALESSAKVNQGLQLVGKALAQPAPAEEKRADSALDFASEFAKLEEKRQAAWKTPSGKGN